MSNFKDQEQANYTADPATVDLSVIIETYKALLTGDSLPERVAVQTVVLQKLLNAAAATPSPLPGLVRYGERDEYVLHSEAAAIIAGLDNRAHVAEYKLEQVVNFSLPLVLKRAEAAEAKLADIEKQAPETTDALGVNSFASKMKDKLAIKRQQGRYGWQDMNADDLSVMLHQCVKKGDPLDVGNLCMMLSQNGQSIFPAEQEDQWQNIATIDEREHGRLIIIGTYDAKGKWCAAVRGTKQFIAELNNPTDVSLKKTMRLKWEPTHFMELTVPTSEAGE